LPDDTGVILSTGFTGRTVSGKTASDISWIVGGVRNPGDLTWTLAGGGPTGTALFDTVDAQGHFAPDLNIGNEGPWSVTIPLTLTVPQIRIENVVLDWQHFNNAGDLQSVSRSANWTVSVTGSSSGLLGSVTTGGVSGISGVETLAFPSPLTLSDAETWELTIFVTGADSTGNNTGLDAVTVNGTALPPPDDFHSWISDPAFGLDPAEQGFTHDPDEDGLANGLEAWFGTHPGQFDPGLVADRAATFIHPRNEHPPADVSGFYEWSPNLSDWYAGGSGPAGGPTVTLIPVTVGTATATVTATASEQIDRLFLRVGASQSVP
jgi:hypothetical protein